MTSNVKDNCNEHDERCESEQYLYDAAIVDDNTSQEDDKVSTECEEPLNEAVFKMLKILKTQFRTATEKVAEPMIEFLKSRTTKPASIKDSLEILFFKSLILNYKNSMKKINVASNEMYYQF
ncbi:Hypothetical protein CINCED_3A019931 [Cinara cedri]|uniref:Uncharacterized protein n=1 Tax=Cinara cedri TaxID=506608 RepID=A0A5E4MR30_9HEMI|nr:Hypothetical protein CINCED_3A019931 [Cinara cedri]